MSDSSFDKKRTKTWRMMKFCFTSPVPRRRANPSLDNPHHHRTRSSADEEAKTTPTTKAAGDKRDDQNNGGATPPVSHRPAPKDVKELRQNPGYSNSDVFTFEEMKLATDHFKPELILGEGGFGSVYKGVLDENVRQGYKRTKVAIKQLNPDGFQGDREWLTEVNYLSHLSHPNLVKLIGYCCEGDQRLLVYEYMSSGCLEKHLFRRMSTTMTWLRRIKVSLDAAKGLAYLHGLERPIIYRDFKTSNILLDSNFDAKLADFGLAKEGPLGDETHVSTRVMGTYGYAAPEYVMTGHLTARSDVYGFGVVLLEILIGRRALEKSRPNKEHSLVEWCRPLLNNSKKLPRVLDPRINGQYLVKGMMRVANVAYQCLSNNPKDRPLMSQVVEILEMVYAEENSVSGGRSRAAKKEVIASTSESSQSKSEREEKFRCQSGERCLSEPEDHFAGIDSPAPDILPHTRSAREARD